MRKTQTYKSLPYNPALKDKAKALRKAGFLHEALLWNQLKSKNFNGLDFDRQKIIGNYIVDFYCAEKAVVIEVDGSSHNNKQGKDAKRDTYLKSLRLVVIRLLVKDVLRNMEGVIFYLRNHPALAGTPPEEGNKEQKSSAPSEEGNKKQDSVIPPREGNKNQKVGAPPEEGNKKQDSGAPLENGNINQGE